MLYYTKKLWDLEVPRDVVFSVQSATEYCTNRKMEIESSHKCHIDVVNPSYNGLIVASSILIYLFLFALTCNHLLDNAG